MRKSIMLPAVVIAIAAGAWALLPVRGHEAAAQSGPYIVNAISLEIAPDQFDKFMEVAKENAAASTKDPGCREFNIVVAQDNPHHIMFSRSTTTPQPSTCTARPSTSRNSRRSPRTWSPSGTWGDSFQSP